MRWRAGCAVLACCVVAACAPMDKRTTRPDTPWYRAVVEPRLSDPDRILRYYDRLRTMKSSELSRELEATRQLFENDKSEINRLQLALLLSYPGTGFRDDNIAIALLNPVVKDKSPDASTLRPLAMLLQSDLLELRRSEEASQQQIAKSKEEHLVKLKEEQRRSEALQQKLDAILDMEMKMIEREQNTPKKK